MDNATDQLITLEQQKRLLIEKKEFEMALIIDSSSEFKKFTQERSMAGARFLIKYAPYRSKTS